MTSNLDDFIAKAKQMAENDHTGALSLANELAEKNPNEMKVWILRGYLHELSDDYDEAVVDLTRAIEINPMEPRLFYSRGRYRFALSDDRLAIDDFTKGLELCDRYKKDDYREELFFWRAEALLRLGKKREALSDLAHVPGDYTSWTYKLRTKADLLADCSELPG